MNIAWWHRFSARTGVAVPGGQHVCRVGLRGSKHLAARVPQVLGPCDVNGWVRRLAASLLAA